MYRYYFLIFILIILDQVSKWLIDLSMNIGEKITIIPSFFFITSHRNEGAAWGILEGQMMFFYLVTIVVVSFLFYYLHTEGRISLFLRISICFIIGGALGNFIDRLLRKEVIDFLDFNIFGYDYPIFNFADTFLVSGAILLIIYMLKEEKSDQKVE